MAKRKNSTNHDEATTTTTKKLATVTAVNSVLISNRKLANNSTLARRKPTTTTTLIEPAETNGLAQPSPPPAMSVSTLSPVAGLVRTQLPPPAASPNLNKVVTKNPTLNLLLS